MAYQGNETMKLPSWIARFVARPVVPAPVTPSDSEAREDQHEPIRVLPKRYDGHIALFGTRSAGKTVYVASLYNEYNASSQGFHVSFDSESSAKYLNEISDFCVGYGNANAPDEREGKGLTRSWPDGTTTENEVGLLLDLESDKTLGKAQLRVQLYDPPGGYLALGGDSTRKDASKRMKDFVAAADGVLMFFEPDNFSFHGLCNKVSNALEDLLPWQEASQPRYERFAEQLLQGEDEQSRSGLLQLLRETSTLTFTDLGRGDDWLDRLLRELELLRAEYSKETKRHDAIRQTLMALLRDEEFMYWLRKHEINVDPLKANPIGEEILETPSGRKVNVLSVLLNALQAGPGNDVRQSITDRVVLCYKRASNARFMAATERLQEIITGCQSEGTTHRSVAIVIVKADELEVFRQSPRKPFVLIPPEIEPLKFKEDSNRLGLLRDALKKHWGKVDARWGKVLDELFDGPLKGLLLRLMSFPGDFQIFFVSSVGEVERDSLGFPRPPRILKPEGVDAPMLWTAHQIYTRAMVQRAIRRIVRWAVLPIGLFLVPLLVWIYNVSLESAARVSGEPQIVRYERLAMIPSPAQSAAWGAVASHRAENFKEIFEHRLQGRFTLSAINLATQSTGKTGDEVDVWSTLCAQQTSGTGQPSLKGAAELLLARMSARSSAQVSIAEHLSQTISLACVYVETQRNYQVLRDKFQNLTGMRNEVSLLLDSTDGFLSQLEKDLAPFRKKGIGSDADARVAILTELRAGTEAARGKLLDYTGNGVSMTFKTSSASAELIGLFPKTADQALKSGDPFLWRPQYKDQEADGLRLVALVDNVEVSEGFFYDPKFFQSEIQIKIGDQYSKVFLVNTWNSYEDAFQSLLKPFDDVVYKALGGLDGR